MGKNDLGTSSLFLVWDMDFWKILTVDFVTFRFLTLDFWTFRVLCWDSGTLTFCLNQDLETCQYFLAPM